jgi:hypothetical protein
VLIENCHWGADVPASAAPSDCPFHMFRSSVDIHPTWESVFNNLQTVDRFAQARHRCNIVQHLATR